MTIAIVEDEQHCTDRLLSLLEPYRNKVEVVTYDNVADAVKGIDSVRPGIVFLDVQIGNDTGFDVLAGTVFHDFSLVFTTAFEQYAIEAFRFSALDYLLKPLTKADFERAMQKSFYRQEQVKMAEKLDVLFSHFSSAPLSRKISVPTTDGYVFLRICDIIHCRSEINYTYIFTTDSRKYTVARTLKQFEDLLTPYGFFRIHNSHLVNLAYVVSVGRNGYLTLSDGTSLEIATRRKEKLLEKLKL